MGRLRFLFLLFLFLLTGRSYLSAQSFTITDLPQTPLLNASSIDGGDYDNDGDIDLLVRWNDAGTWKAEIVRNTSTAATISFATTGIFIANVTGDCIWGDINNDSKLDIIASGNNGADFLTAFVYNAGTYTTQVPISSDLATSLDWGDVDADGDQDLLVSTTTESFIMKRTAANIFSKWTSNTFSINSILADYDLDGDLDVVGDGIYSNYLTEFLKTHELFPTANGYTNLGYCFPFDLDGDGDRDLMRAERVAARGNISFEAVAYFNQNGIFSRVSVESIDDFSGEFVKPIGAGDFDNNGDAEMVYVTMGNRASYFMKFTEVKSQKVTELTLPPNSRFHYISGYLIADLNGDQRLDIITTGSYVNTTTSATVSYAKSYRNLAPSNAKPSVPSNLTTTIEGGSVTISWNKSTDTETPAAALTYNFYLRQGIDTLISSYATRSGKPRVSSIKGSAESNTFKFPQLPDNGSYSWAVQAKDAAGNYSAFSTEKSFEFAGGNSEVNHSSSLTSQSISYDPKNDQYILVGLQGGNVYAVLMDGKFGERKSALKKLNQFTTSCLLPKVAVDSAGTYLVTWIADSLSTPKRLWGKFVKSDLTVPLANEWRACEKIFYDPGAVAQIVNHDVRFNPARSAFDLAWTFLGDTGGVSARRTRLQGSVPKHDPIRNIEWTFVSGTLHGARGYQDVSIDSDPKSGKSVAVYTFENERAEGNLTSLGKVYFQELDQNLLSPKDSIPAASFTYGSSPHIVYNPYLRNFIVIWNAHFQHQATPLPQDGYNESRDVAAASLSFSTNGTLTTYLFPSTISKTQQQGGQGGALNPNLAFNYDRNEYLISWHNTNAGKIYAQRINPLDNVTVTPDEFQLKNSLSETPNVSFAKKHNHFILGFLQDGNGTTSILDLPNDIAPVVASLSKSKAYAGEKIIITGSNFGKTPYLNSVYFGGIKAKVDTLFWDRTKLQVTVPVSSSRAKVPVVVSFDGQPSNNTILFENITDTNISSVTPLAGEPGVLVTITGINFPDLKSEFLVTFGDAVASLDDIESNTPTQIKVKVPQNAVRGLQDVAVVIQDIPNVYGSQFDVTRIPSIDSVVPYGGGNELISEKVMDINGFNLSFKPDDLTVTIGDLPDPLIIDAATTTNLKVRIPRGIEGKQVIKVKVKASEDLKDQTTKLSDYEFVLGGDIKSKPVDSEFRFNSKRTDDFLPLEVEVYNYETVDEIRFWTKGISADDNSWSSIPLEIKDNNRIPHNLNEADFPDDPIGLEGYYESLDLSGVVKKSKTFRVFRDNIGGGATAPIPDLRFGGDISDYNIISIPYELSPNKINTVFKSILDVYGYDKSKWRIIHYKNDDNGKGEEGYVEYLAGLDEINEGKGYWMIARNPQDIIFDLGKTLHSSDNGVYGPFEIILNPGWNQIGNPYDFNVSWSDIIDYNTGKVSDDELAKIESFKTFKDGSFQAVNTIDRYRGGFVLLNGNDSLKLQIPFKQNPAINGGRKKDESRRFVSKLDEKEWRMALDLSAGKLQNRISSFGMHPQATDGVDQKDEHKLPEFIQSLDLYFPQSLSTSIVSTNDYHTWEVDVTNTTDSEEVTIQWDNTSFGDNDRELFLQDISGERLIDMRKENHYTFIYHEGYSFKIHFGDKSYIENVAKPSGVVLSDAYPNPMRSTTSIPFTVTKERTHVHLAIYSLQGQELQTLVNDNLDPGFYELEWDGKGPGGDTVTSGVVIYRLQTSESVNGVKSNFKKLVIAP